MDASKTTVAPEFAALSESAVRAALTGGDSPVRAEVTRLVTEYVARFWNHCARQGYIPSSFVRLKGKTPIEEVAMQEASRRIREFLGMEQR